MFSKGKSDNRDPYLAILEYRITSLSCAKSPSQLLMSRRLRSILPATSVQLKPQVVKKAPIREKFLKIQQREKVTMTEQQNLSNRLKLVNRFAFKDMDYLNELSLKEK